MTVLPIIAKPVRMLATYGGHPVCIISLILFCLFWAALGLDLVVLTTILSVLALTFSQAIMFKQDEDACESKARDKANHAKLDELLAATTGARDDLIHIEDEAEEVIERKRR